MADRPSFLARAHSSLIWFGGIYVVICALLAVPVVQQHALFAHKIRWPMNAKFDTPERYGLAPNRALNLNITTADNVHIGAWLILSDSFYRKNYQPNVPFTTEDISRALTSHPTILYFHGNAASRAVSYRVSLYSTYSTRLEANLLAIDYRGFGDSQGTPSEEGLAKDARAAWDWLVSRGTKAADVVLMGQSLGTGIATKLGAELASENISPRGLVLIAGFSSVPDLLENYRVGGGLPLFQPLQTLPFAIKLIKKFVYHPFNTLATLPNVTCPIILIHADDDYDIPKSHSLALFDALLEPHLPPIPFTMEELLQKSGELSQDDKWNAVDKVNSQRQELRRNLVDQVVVEGFATLSRFERKENMAAVLLVEAKWGGHNRVGVMEGIVDTVGSQLSLR